MLGYVVDQQKLCPMCNLPGIRAEEQEEGSIFALYNCPWGHTFEIDRIFEIDIAALSERIYKQQMFS